MQINFVNFAEPDAKKNSVLQPPQGPPPVGRPLQAGMGGPVLGGGPQLNEDIKVPDKMVGLSKYHIFIQKK